ncbi:MAG TPA: S8 family serine peptidase [Blastocatellia bacterium]|nr:S8 family serine peptidase [Blastocatellia bacterium]
MRLTKSFPILVVVALAASAVSFPTRGVAAAEGADPIRRGEIVVELQAGASIEAVNERNRTSTILQIYGTNFYRLRIPANKREKKWRKRLAADEDVLSAALNPIVSSPGLFGRSTTSFPDGYAAPGLSVAAFNAQQGLFDLLKLEDVSLRSRGAGTVVAIIDTGVDRTHPALTTHMWSNSREHADGVDNDGNGLVDDIDGWNFVDSNNDTAEKPDDPLTTVAGHGTFIAGLVALVAPECLIMPVRAFPAGGVSDAFTVAAAVKYAADHGADVINLSLGSSEPSELLQEAIVDSRARGITIVAAVGNDGTKANPQFPSSLAEVMAVAAIELSGQKALFSNFGGHVDVCAPGVGLVSTFPGHREGEYARWSGTSFAAPLAAAEAALVLAADPRQPDVKQVIEDTAAGIEEFNPGFAGKLGKGRIDPLRALQSLNGTSPRPSSDVHSQIELTRGPVGGVAFGKAIVNVKGARQEFTVETHALSVRTTYKLIVDGNALASDVSASLGSLSFAFVTEPGRAPLPPAIEPVTKIRHVELRDSLDRVVLQGNFSADNSSPVGGFVEREARLLSTGVLPQAAGSASVRIEALADSTRRELLSVSAEGLISEASYRLIVDGTNVGGPIVRSGFLRVILTSDGSSGQLLPPSLRPVINIRFIELQDATGRVVLQGNFAVNQ